MLSGNGERAVGHGQWVMGNGPWAIMAHDGPWAMGNGQWAMGHGPWEATWVRSWPAAARRRSRAVSAARLPRTPSRATSRRGISRRYYRPLDIGATV